MNRKVRLLLALDGFRLTAFGLLGPVYAIFVEQIGGDILDVGTAFAVYSITIGSIAYLTGKLGDRSIKPSRLLLIGHFFEALGFFGYLFVHNPAQLIIVQLILGIGMAIESPAFDSLLSVNADKGRHSSEWGDWEAMANLVNGITAIIGAAIAKFYGFQVLFILMTISSLTSMLFTYRFRLRDRN